VQGNGDYGNLEKQPVEKYLDDIATIKDLLVKQERKSIIEPWAFISWSVLIFAGSVIQFILAGTLDPGYEFFIYALWLPLVVIAALLETVAWARSVRRRKLPITATTNVTLLHVLLVLSGGLIVLLFILLNLDGYRYLPPFVCAGSAVMVTAMSGVTRAKLYLLGELLFLGAVALLLLDLHGPVVDLSTGLCISAVFLAGRFLYGAYLDREG